jgi:hypothetical protein
MALPFILFDASLATDSVVTTSTLPPEQTSILRLVVTATKGATLADALVREKVRSVMQLNRKYATSMQMESISAGDRKEDYIRTDFKGTRN